MKMTMKIKPDGTIQLTDKERKILNSGKGVKLGEGLGTLKRAGGNSNPEYCIEVKNDN